MTAADFVTTSGAIMEERGFFEREIGRTTERFGNIAHVFSAYDSKSTREDAEPFARGINSIQLLHDGTRWWVVTIFWDSERAGNAIPARYLGTGRHP
jgi:heme-degrading monooxygenase HmoA